MANLFGKIAQRAIDYYMGSGLMQEENDGEVDGEKYVTPGIDALLRQAAGESCVLLKNNGVLPLAKDERIAVFGRCQADWFYVGYGSGGDVHPPYKVNLLQGLMNRGANFDRTLAREYITWTSSKEHKADHGWWGHWPFSHPEMPLSEHTLARAAAKKPTAVVVIGRAAGEDRENTLEEGSYYLSAGEREMLDKVCENFSKVVVLLNIGNIIDMSWVKEYGDKLSAVMIVWQGGMESGNAVADVLYGDVEPSGRLSDSIANTFEDYPSSANFGGEDYNEYAEGIFVGYRYFDKHPEKVLYPFGYGLGYTAFQTECVSAVEKCADAQGEAGEGACADAQGSEDEKCAGICRNGDAFMTSAKVLNTGAHAGKETVLLWCYPPAEGLEKPIRVLAAFGKTDLLQPGESDTVTLSYDEKCIASYDESIHAFVLEAGEYRFKVNDTDYGSISVPERKIVEQCEDIRLDSPALRERLLARMPGEIPAGEAKEGTLKDVLEGKITLENFVAGLSFEELEALTRGEGGMNSDLGTVGNAGAFGGVIESLRDKGVPPIITCDGPAGLRLKKYTALIPCGTALACTFDTALVEQIHKKIGEEMIHYEADVQLAPGMNIHRNPLCGRNFEYFSEDPLLSGKMAAAVIRGVQSMGRSSCPKHFACNNQEFKRNTNDSRVSERALREIYLRNFEIAVKEGKPRTIMTSYNKVNGVWSHYHYDLVTTVLRGEWKYEGMVMTDWWMKKSKSPEFPEIKDNAYRVRAQVDVLMPGGMAFTEKHYKSDGSMVGIDRGELHRTARNVLKLALHKLQYLKD